MTEHSVTFAGSRWSQKGYEVVCSCGWKHVDPSCTGLAIDAYGDHCAAAEREAWQARAVAWVVIDGSSRQWSDTRSAAEYIAQSWRRQSRYSTAEVHAVVPAGPVEPPPTLTDAQRERFEAAAERGLAANRAKRAAEVSGFDYRDETDEERAARAAADVLAASERLEET